MWTYSVSGKLLTAPSGQPSWSGYSGFGASRDRPEDEALPGLGPIPAGLYVIGDVESSPTKGPVMMRLTPVGHDAHGRSQFEIHGDSREHPGAASHGCIILARAAREAIAASDDRELLVT